MPAKVARGPPDSHTVDGLEHCSCSSSTGIAPQILTTGWQVTLGIGVITGLLAFVIETCIEFLVP